MLKDLIIERNNCRKRLRGLIRQVNGERDQFDLKLLIWELGVVSHRIAELDNRIKEQCKSIFRRRA